LLDKTNLLADLRKSDDKCHDKIYKKCGVIFSHIVQTINLTKIKVKAAQIKVKVNVDLYSASS